MGISQIRSGIIVIFSFTLQSQGTDDMRRIFANYFKYIVYSRKNIDNKSFVFSSNINYMQITKLNA